MLRLLETGVAPELMLPTLTEVVAQRLVHIRHRVCRGRGGFASRRSVGDWTMPLHAERIV